MNTERSAGACVGGAGVVSGTRWVHLAALITCLVCLLVAPSARAATDRAVELVSPPDKRPAGAVEIANPLAGIQLFFQAARDGESIGYPIFNGFADSVSGGEVIYAGARGNGGWSATQVTPQALVPSPEPGLSNGRAGAVRYFSPDDLGCAVVETHVPLTPDTPPASTANGVYNLYRWDRSSGNYTLLTNRVPRDPTVVSISAPYYSVIGASSDCSRVFFFSSQYELIAGDSGLYEWHDGVLRDAGLLPNGNVPLGGVSEGVTRQKYSVSPNGRVFFVAFSNEFDEFFKQAVFVRKTDGEVINASRSETSTPTNGARYQAASRDGSRVFFLANPGLTTDPSTGPPEPDNCSTVTQHHELACDLYSFDVDAEQLTNLSATVDPANSKGAVVQGLLDVSKDGSTVYFAARGQLVPGEGRTYIENLAGSKFANVYRWQDGNLSYIGALTNEDMAATAKGTGEAPSALIHVPNGWNSQTTDSGDYFLFGSRDDMTGTNPDTVYQAYLYSDATEATECISCPQDGSAPAPEGPFVIQQALSTPNVGNYTPRSLSEDGRAFFTTLDALTPDAVEGKDTSEFETENNIYEWDHGDVSLIASGLVRMIDIGGTDARDVFITSDQRLDPHDFDFATDLYDFRAGGGFPPPPEPPVPCDPAADACQGPATPQPPGIDPPSKRVGDGRPACKDNQVRRNGQCVAKNKIARQICRKKKGAAKQRCIRQQVRQLNRIEDFKSRVLTTRANDNGRAGK